jgi:MFS family permease
MTATTAPEQSEFNAGAGPFLAAFAPVLLGTALYSFASWGLSALMSVRLAASTAPAVAIGIVLSCHFAGFIIGCRLCPPLIVRLGHVRASAVFAAGAASLSLLLALVEPIAAWGVLRLGTGITVAGLYTMTESWLNQSVGSAVRGRCFGIYVTVSSGASALGPLGLNLGDPASWELFSFIAIAFLLSPLPMIVATPRVPVVEGAPRLRLRALIANAPGGVIACFGHGLVLSAISQVSALYFAVQGFDNARLSVFLSAVTIAGVVMQWPVGWLSDRFGRQPVLLAQALLTTLGGVALALIAQPSYMMVLILGIAIVGMAKPFYSLGVTIANDRLRGTSFVDAAGGLLLSWAAGAMTGPVIATALIGIIGPAGMFWHIAGAALALTGVAAQGALAGRKAAPATATRPATSTTA